MVQRPQAGGHALALRPACAADLDEILAIEQGAFPTPWSRSAFAAHLGEEGFLVGCWEGRLVGYVLVALQTPSLFDRLEKLTRGLLGQAQPEEVVGHVMNLAVHPGWRGRGLGRRLLRAGLAYLERLGATCVELEVRVDNAVALALYRTEGFAIERLLKGYYQNGDDAYLMSKRLSR